MTQQFTSILHVVTVRVALGLVETVLVMTSALHNPSLACHW